MYTLQKLNKRNCLYCLRKKVYTIRCDIYYSPVSSDWTGVFSMTQSRDTKWTQLDRQVKSYGSTEREALRLHGNTFAHAQVNADLVRPYLA